MGSDKKYTLEEQIKNLEIDIEDAQEEVAKSEVAVTEALDWRETRVIKLMVLNRDLIKLLKQK